MIRDEDGQLAGYVYVDTATDDIGGYVGAARQAIATQLGLPAGYHARLDRAIRVSGAGT